MSYQIRCKDCGIIFDSLIVGNTPINTYFGRCDRCNNKKYCDSKIKIAVRSLQLNNKYRFFYANMYLFCCYCKYKL